MPGKINWERLNARARDFNNLYKTNFDFSNFYTNITTLRNMDPKNAANIAYKGTLGAVLKDALVIACHNQSESTNAEATAVDLMQVVENFEEALMKPFANECRTAKEPHIPQPYGGLNKKQKLDLVERIVNASPTNDVQVTEQAYLKGKIALRDIRANVNEMPFAVGKGVDLLQIKRIATFMLALEKVNKDRPLWWRWLHPFRNHAEKRDAKEYRTVLNSFKGNALLNGIKLASQEYKALEVTKASIRNERIELDKENKESSVQKDNVEINLENDVNKEFSKKVDENVKVNNKSKQQGSLNKNA